MAGRPRKPTAVLEMSGAFRHNPARKRARAAEPKVLGSLGGPPAHFLEPSGVMNKYPEIWNELAAQVPPGVGSMSDRIQFETLVKVTAELRRPGTPKPALVTAQKEILKLFHMNPVSRAGGAVAIEEPKDEFEKFMRSSRKAG